MMPKGATHFIDMAGHVFYIKYRKGKPFIYEYHDWYEFHSIRYKIKPL